MLKPSTWQHLRFPFSIFLAPVFLFALCLALPAVGWQVGLVFVILHLLVYPASNGYNSYFDKDEESIGGVEKPLPVSTELYHTALVMDAVALGLALLISWHFAVMLLVYGLVSKAYSHPAIRLKKYPILGWLVVGFFQGYFTWWMVWVALQGWHWEAWNTPKYQLAALLSSLLLWGSYPMTQVYQHAEDARRGDRTLSLRLGIKGTFHFVAAFFGVATVGFGCLFVTYFSPNHLIFFALSLLPVLFFFGWWYVLVRKNVAAADFKNTMRLNLISSLGMILFFGGWALSQIF